MAYSVGTVAPFSKRFTDFDPALDLDGVDSPVAAGALPVGVVVEVGTADQILVYTDLAGVENSMVFRAVGTFYLPLAPATVNTTTTITGLTVLWLGPKANGR